jgi:hypothetical protein
MAEREQPLGRRVALEMLELALDTCAIAGDRAKPCGTWNQVDGYAQGRTRCAPSRREHRTRRVRDEVNERDVAK